MVLQEKYADAKANLDKTTAQLAEANVKQQSLTAMISEKYVDMVEVMRTRNSYAQLYVTSMCSLNICLIVLPHVFCVTIDLTLASVAVKNKSIACNHTV